MLGYMDLGVEYIRGSTHPQTPSGKNAYHRGLSRKVHAVDAIYVYAFSDFQNAARQVRNVTSEAEVVSGQYY